MSQEMNNQQNKENNNKIKILKVNLKISLYYMWIQFQEHRVLESLKKL